MTPFRSYHSAEVQKFNQRILQPQLTEQIIIILIIIIIICSSTSSILLLPSFKVLILPLISTFFSFLAKFGVPFVSQNPREFYGSYFLGRILICAYTIYWHGQIFIACRILIWLVFPFNRFLIISTFCVICCIPFFCNRVDIQYQASC